MNYEPNSSSSRTDKRELIIDQAAQLFNEMGYADTRLEDIGSRLRTPKTSVSYHFKTKERLLSEVYGRAIDFSEHALQAAKTEATGLDAMLAWIAAHAQAHADALSGTAKPLALIADLSAIALDKQSSVASRYSDLLADCWSLMERGEEDGSICVPSKPAALFFILNVLHWLPRWLADVRLIDQASAIEGLIDLLKTGLAQDATRPPARPINETQSYESDSAFDRAARNKLKREAFLRAGSRALNAHGYRSLSLNKAAAELGVTRGAFYYHIADKDALLQGCFERTCETIEKAQSLAEDGDPPAIEILERSLRWLFERQISNLDPLTRISLLSALDSKSRLLITARLNRLRSGFADVIARGMIDDSIRPIDLSAIEQLVMGSVFASSQRRDQFLRQSIFSEKPQDQISAVSYYSVLFNGLAGAPNRS